MGPEDSSATSALSVDCEALRAFAASISAQSAAVDAVESAARLSSAAAKLPGTSVGAALSRAAGPLGAAHTALATELAAQSDTAACNAHDYAQAEDSIAGGLGAPAEGTR